MKPLCRISSFAFLTTIVVVVVVICLIELQFLSQPEGVAASDVLTSGVSSPSNVELQYGIVIDCGSSGTRIFIYCWPPHNGDPKDLLDLSLAKDKNGKPAVKKIEPGLILQLVLWLLVTSSLLPSTVCHLILIVYKTNCISVSVVDKDLLG